MRVLIIGCGYVGLPLGAELARLGHEVFGLRRTKSDDTELITARIFPLTADITNRATLSNLPRPFDWVVNCAASGGGDAESYRRLYFDGTRNVIEWLSSSLPRKYVYTSSTSVYAQNDGSVVTESDFASPETDTGKVLVATEKILLAAASETKFPATILRLSGIYGPGRGYWLKQFLNGEARIEGVGERYLNLIHRDDVIGAIIAALNRAPVGSVFNATDNEPVTQRDFFEWLAKRLNKPLPPNVPEGSTERKRGASNKRVSNSRLRQQLGYEFKYPTFREGYEAEIQKR
jgi:nucleoside-diphosphate-sugar epimerase